MTIQGHHIAPRITVILHELKHMITEKYPIVEMRLFGSNARGEATQDSDIDVFLQLLRTDRTIEEDVYDMAYELELKYDCLIDVILLSDSMVKTYSEQLPIYHSILQEGQRV
jgi:uncharacterized protein